MEPETVADQWREIGIQANVKERERGPGFSKTRDNEHHIFIWNYCGRNCSACSPARDSG
jgi:hypothetical protein